MRLVGEAGGSTCGHAKSILPIAVPTFKRFNSRLHGVRQLACLIVHRLAQQNVELQHSWTTGASTKGFDFAHSEV